MSENKHTPGTWEIGEGDKEGQLVIQETTTGMGLRIAFLGNLGPERTQANAESLARAPDLLRENEDMKTNIEFLGRLKSEYEEKIGIQKARNAELLEAAKKAVAWIWDPEADQLEQFERIADEFYRDTGLLRPGKSEPLGFASEERGVSKQVPDAYDRCAICESWHYTHNDPRNTRARGHRFKLSEARKGGEP